MLSAPMKFRSLRRTVPGLVLVLLLGSFGSRASADFSISNLSATQGFNALSGWNLTGSRALNNQAYAIAVRFTMPTTTSMTFASAQLALAYRAGTNALDVSLMTDLRGIPSGTMLETMHLSNITAVPGLVTATSTAHSVLAAGTSYWLVATYGGTNTNISWFFNNTGRVGQAAYRPDTLTTQGDWISAPGSTDPAYALFGAISPGLTAVNAPSSGVLVAIGGLGLVGGRWCQRRRQVPSHAVV